MNPLQRILWSAAAAILGVVLLTLVALMLANAHMRADLARAQADVTLCRSANEDFMVAAQKQNHAIAIMRADAQKRAQRAQTHERLARKQLDTLARAHSTADACHAAGELINDFVRSLP